MRITNHYSPLAVLAEILAYTDVDQGETIAFTEKDLSSHDHLLSELRDRLDAILNSFKRLGCDTYETQGLDDSGVDILWKFDEEGKFRRVGFQIKSNREADDCAALSKAFRQRNQDLADDPEDTLLKTLKRQAQEARQQTRVDEWWVLPCFNLKKHKKRLVAINTYFQLYEDPSWPTKIVQPEKLFGLLSMSPGDIDAFCTRLLCRKDEVLTAARNEFEKLSSAARNLVGETFYSALCGEVQLDDDALFAVTRDFDDGVNELEALDELESLGYIKRPCLDSPRMLDPHAFNGLCALYFEGRVRHRLKSTDAIRFVWRLLDDINPSHGG